MRQISSVKRATLALLVVCMVLLLIAAVELLYPAGIEDAELMVDEQAATEVPTFSESVYLPPRMEDLAEMLDRPLFFSDRKLPPEPETTAAPVAPPTPLRLKLEGVAITSESRIAVLRDLNNNQLIQLAEGMSHDGWTLDAVTAAGASFKRGTQVAELGLEPDTNNRRRR